MGVVKGAKSIKKRTRDIMKKLLMLAIVSAFVFSSCNDEDGGVSDALVDQLDMDTEAALEAAEEDVSSIIEAGMADLLEGDGGRIERDRLLDCATVTKDTINRVLTIDYGTGCEGPNGRVRKGQVIISYTDKRLIPGASRSVSLVDFYIDEVQIEGTRTVTNVSASLDDHPTFNSTLVGGKLTFEDETSATRDANHTRTWIRANNPLEDESTVEGGASGVRRDGTSYVIEIIEPLVYKRDCRRGRVFIPVQGIKQITSGDNVAIIDFGDGTCDNEVTITINGETTTRTLNHRGR